MTHSKILLTGATGFVGARLANRLISESASEVVLATRSPVAFKGGHHVAVDSLSHSTNWLPALSGVQVVIHSAARAHVMNEAEQDALAVYRDVNVDGTLNLARQAAQVGVRRFLFVSSIKVNGEVTVETPFSPFDKAAPLDPYGQSKYKAEEGLKEIAASTGMEVVLIRPPLVYGAGVKGNFKSLLAVTSKQFPLPLGAVRNKRSLVALDNLVDLIITCLDHPDAANKTFLVSDDEDLSTSELLKRLGMAGGKPARLFPVPASWLRIAAKLVGRSAVADRLLGDLQLDISHTKETLGWTPPISVDEGLRRCFESRQPK